MKTFSPNQLFQAGDTWPVGSFCLTDCRQLLPLIIECFDVPCWPELTGIGTAEELLGFWVPLYQKWEQENQSGLIIETALKNRPGMSAFLKTYSGKPLPLVKGQLLGPVSLMAALKKKQFPFIDRDKILQFIGQSVLVQSDLLSKISQNRIICLDEPWAFTDVMAHRVWQELWDVVKFDPQIGLALHSCGPVKSTWFELPWHVVHVDFQELATGLAADARVWESTLEAFFKRGSWLAIGVLSSSPIAPAPDIAELMAEVKSVLKGASLNQILISTSCGVGDMNITSTKSRLQQLCKTAEAFVALASGAGNGRK